MRVILCSLCAAAVAVMVGGMPGEALGQHCRRSCAPGEGRDARGCCVPADPRAKTALRKEAEKEAKRERAPARRAARPDGGADDGRADGADDGDAAKGQAGVRRRAGADRPQRAGSGEIERTSPLARRRRERAHRFRGDEPAGAVRERGQNTEAAPGSTRPVVQPETPGEQMRARTPEVSDVAPADSRGESPARAPAEQTLTPPGSVNVMPASEQVEDLLTGDAAFMPTTRAVPERRWATWMPWAAVGTGAAVTALGGVLYWRASANYDRFDVGFDPLCGNGCRDEQVPELANVLERAGTQERWAKVSLVAGGAVMTAGLVMALLDRSRQSREEPGDMTQVSLVPMVSPHVAGVAAGISF